MLIVNYGDELTGSMVNLCELMPAVLREMKATGLYTKHSSSTTTDRLMTDADELKASVKRLAIRFNDADQIKEVYNNIVIMHDRMNLEVAKMNAAVSPTQLVMCHRLLARLKNLRNKFMSEHKGVDYASRYADKNGNLYTPNTLLKTEKAGVLERGRILDID
jgi:organic radical activating enzyme